MERDEQAGEQGQNVLAPMLGDEPDLRTLRPALAGVDDASERVVVPAHVGALE